MRLGKVLKAWRYGSQLDLRDAAKVLGVGHSTLSRIENGKQPDGKTLGKILFWLIGEEPNENGTGEVQRGGAGAGPKPSSEAPAGEVA